MTPEEGKKLKVGDKVKVLKDNANYALVKAGDIGIVIAINRRSADVEMDTGDAWGFRWESIELVQPAIPSYGLSVPVDTRETALADLIGRKFKIIKSNNPLLIGEIVKLIEINGGTQFARFQCYNGNILRCSIEEVWEKLELIDDLSVEASIEEPECICPCTSHGIVHTSTCAWVAWKENK